MFKRVMHTPNENGNYTDDSVNDYYDSRVTFDSSRAPSKAETEKQSKLRAESILQNNSSTSHSASHPTSSNPSHFFMPSNLEHISVSSTNTVNYFIF